MDGGRAMQEANAMGLLDELEQEAERQRIRDAQLSEQREAREQYWDTQLLPAMRALDDFLHRLRRHANQWHGGRVRTGIRDGGHLRFCSFSPF